MNNDFEAALCTFLKSRTEISGVVGTNVFPAEAFQVCSYPFITYEQANDEQVHNLTGDDSLTWIWYTLTIYSPTAHDRTILKDALRNILSGKINKLLTYTGGSVILSSAWLMSGGRDFYHNPPDASEQGLYERKMTFRLCFRQTVPTL